MLFVKLDENKNAISYAISWENIRALRPDFSIPFPPPKEILDELGFGIYENTERPNDNGPLAKYIEDLPIKDGDIYKQAWKKVDLEGSDRERALTTGWNLLRSQRNSLLIETDIYMLEDMREKLTAEKLQEWKNYRQQLRDLPAAVTNPFEVIWPTKPE